MNGSQSGRVDGDTSNEPRELMIGEVPPTESADDRQTVLRVEHLPREAGWMLVAMGMVGLVLPGMPGAPFLLAGGFVLAPGGPRILARWAGPNPPKFVHSAMRQIGRFLDDLERRYPRNN